MGYREEQETRDGSIVHDELVVERIALVGVGGSKGEATAGCLGLISIGIDVWSGTQLRCTILLQRVDMEMLENRQAEQRRVDGEGMAFFSFPIFSSLLPLLAHPHRYCRVVWYSLSSLTRALSVDPRTERKGLNSEWRVSTSQSIKHQPPSFGHRASVGLLGKSLYPGSSTTSRH